MIIWIGYNKKTLILDRIQRRQLKWYGHLLRMKDSHWPKKIYQWTPHGGRRRPQQLWNKPVTDFMRSGNMEKPMAGDIHLWHLGKDRRVLAL